MELFSQRNGVEDKILDLKDMPAGMRNRIWNKAQDVINSSVNRNALIKKIWGDFFKKDDSKLHGKKTYI